jgi:hypothetical protein
VNAVAISAINRTSIHSALRMFTLNEFDVKIARLALGWGGLLGRLYHTHQGLNLLKHILAQKLHKDSGCHL